jgi:diguanylate cyclase (GGDEF)-like protein
MKPVGTFTKEARVSLFYLIRDLFPPPTQHWMGGETGGYELKKLEELTRRKLQRLSLGKNHEDAVEIIQHFIMTAAEEDLWEMIRMAPAAQLIADREEEQRRPRYSRFSTMNDDNKVERVLNSLNLFFTDSDLNARFGMDGVLQVGGLEVSLPQELRDLEGKDQLLADTNSELQQLPISVIGIDLDGFKAVNDTKGHLAGDECLAKVAKTISSAIRGKGRLYRPGGDEFVVLLPNFSGPEGFACAERIRANLESANVGDGLPVTASIGVACCLAEESKTAEQILKAADDAMYSSKKAGKNRVTMSELK